MTDAELVALLWARERMATRCEENGFPELAESYRRGYRDESLLAKWVDWSGAPSCRAGAAASAERIKELETNVEDLVASLEAALAAGHRPWVQEARDLIAKVRSQHAARNPLKESDQ